MVVSFFSLPLRPFNDDFIQVESRGQKRRRQRREEREAELLAVNLEQETTNRPTAHNTPLTNVHIFGDSNIVGSRFFDSIKPADIHSSINRLTNNNEQYNINIYSTYQLAHTYNAIKKLTFSPTDILIVATLTNDARQTRKGRRLTTDETRQLQTQILQHSTQYIPPEQIVLLQAPPNQHPEEDICPYNQSTLQVSNSWGVRFAPTLIGDDHINIDGLHLLPESLHLLTKTLACAILRRDPFEAFHLERIPHDKYGPWDSEKGQGMMLRTVHVRKNLQQEGHRLQKIA